MRQKKIWMPYMTIGISLIMIVSCGKTLGYLLILNHNYVNQTNQDLTMEIYNQHDELFKSFTIEKGDTINSHSTRGRGPQLFHIEYQDGDSVIVKFADDKCLTYTDNLDNPNNKIFNIDDYDNFDTRLIEPGVRYNLYYTFTEEDYNLAVDCE